MTERSRYGGRRTYDDRFAHGESAFGVADPGTRLKSQGWLIAGAVHEYAHPGTAIGRSNALLSAQEGVSVGFVRADRPPLRGL